MEEKEIQSKQMIADEIDLVEIINKLWRNRKFIIKVTALFTVLGFLVAITTPNVYTASCTMVPQTGQKNTGGSLSGLAAMAGINLGNIGTGEVLSPIVYPKIMANIDFQKELIYSKFHIKKAEHPITLYDYYLNEKYRQFSLIGTIKKYTIGLPGVIVGLFQDPEKNVNQSDTSSIKLLSKDEKEVIKFVNKNLFLEVNVKDGYVSISANMLEPLLAAELAQKGQELLQKYITEFKIEKVAKNLQFVAKNYEESKRNFETKQLELARYRDANKSVNSAIARTNEEKLTSEYTLLLEIYTELAKQKEQAKISVTETTPILTVIEPVVVPIEKNKPNRAMILIVFSFLGLFIGASYVLLKPYIIGSYQKIKS